MDLVFALCNSAPRRVLLAFVAVVAALLLDGVYLQEVVGLVPCPMCIVQRYAMLLLAACAAVGAAARSRGAHIAAALGVLVCATGGAFVAAVLRAPTEAAIARHAAAFRSNVSEPTG